MHAARLQTKPPRNLSQQVTRQDLGDSCCIDHTGVLLAHWLPNLEASPVPNVPKTCTQTNLVLSRDVILAHICKHRLDSNSWIFGDSVAEKTGMFTAPGTVMTRQCYLDVHPTD